jgi:hypothetical protein
MSIFYIQNIAFIHSLLGFVFVENTQFKENPPLENVTEQAFDDSEISCNNLVSVFVSLGDAHMLSFSWITHPRDVTIQL